MPRPARIPRHLGIRSFETRFHPPSLYELTHGVFNPFEATPLELLKENLRRAADTSWTGGRRAPVAGQSTS